MFDAHILAFKRFKAMEDMRALLAVGAGLNHEWLAKMKVIDANRLKMMRVKWESRGDYKAWPNG